MDEEGGSSRSVPITDDGSVSSKQRLMRLYQMIDELLSDYRTSLEEKHKNERDKDTRIEEEFDEYYSILMSQFFPEIVELREQIAKEEIESNSKKGNKKENGKKDGEEEKPSLKDRLEGKKTDENQTEQQPKKAKKDISSVSKSQKIIEKLDPDLNIKETIDDTFEGKDLDDLDSQEQKLLDSIITSSFEIAFNKADGRNNPGWLLLFFKNIIPDLSKVVSSDATNYMSKKIDYYLCFRNHLDRANFPKSLEDLIDNPRYKNLSAREKTFYTLGFISKGGNMASLDKDGFFHNLSIKILNSTRFSDLEKIPQENQPYNKFNENQEFDNAFKPIPEGEVDTNLQLDSSDYQQKQIQFTKGAKLYYTNDETTPEVTEETLDTLETFLFDQTRPEMKERTADEYVENLRSFNTVSPVVALEQAPALESMEVELLEEASTDDRLHE